METNNIDKMKTVSGSISSSDDDDCLSDSVDFYSLFFCLFASKVPLILYEI